MPGATEAEEALARADEAMLALDVEGAITHLSAAIRGFTAAGQPRQAAMACVRLGDTMANLRGNLTAARAWFARATRLVADLPPCIEQGWVAVAAMGCDVDDPDELLAKADLALDRARRFGDLNCATARPGRSQKERSSTSAASACARSPRRTSPTAGRPRCCSRRRPAPCCAATCSRRSARPPR